MIFDIESAETSFIRKIFYLVHRQTNLIVEIKHLSFQERAQAEKASREFIEQTKNILFDQKKEEEKDKQSKEEIKEKLKIFITRYQAKEAKEQIQYYRKGKISEEERNILKEMEIRIDQLDFDEAEILMKRWEGME